MGQAEQSGRGRFEALFTGWRGLAIGLFAAVGVLLSIQSNGERLREFGIFGASANGTLGYASDRIVGQPGWERVIIVQPGGAAAKAGLTPGTPIRFDHAHEANADVAAGRAVGLTAAGMEDGHNNAPRHITGSPKTSGRAAR